MANFTLSSGSICRPFRSPWGAFPTRGFMISTGISSNLIHVGRIVAFDAQTATNASRILPSSQSSAAVVSTSIVGVAAEACSSNNSTTATDRVISVWEANPMVEFKAVTQGAVLASSNVGAVKQVVWDSTLNIHKVDLSAGPVAAALGNRVLITQNIDAIGDSGGYVAFRFVQSLSTAQTDNLGLYR